MNTILLCFAVVPFLCMRPLLAVGVLITFGAALGSMHADHPLTGIVLWVAGVVVSMLFQALAEAMKRAADAINDAWRELNRRVSLIVLPLVAMGTAVSLLREVAVGGQPAVQHAGFDGRAVVVLGVGALAFCFALLRGQLAVLFADVPLLTETGPKRGLFVAEATWIIVGLGIAFALPAVGAALAALALLSMLGLFFAVRRLVEGARGTCVVCGKRVHRAASQCPSCGAERTAERAGPLGRVFKGPASNSIAQRFSLLAARRCPRCAERLEGRKCVRCGLAPLETEDERKTLAKQVDLRFAAFTPVFAAMGAVPVLGLGGALLAYRLSPASTLGGYVEWHHKLGTRALRWLVIVGLALLQPIPLVGLGAVLVLIGLQHAWARAAFLKGEKTS